jgi:hypothetical protein
MHGMSIHVPLFRPRHNADGIFNSICHLCFITMANSENDSQLAEAEEVHVCVRDWFCARLTPKARLSIQTAKSA